MAAHETFTIAAAATGSAVDPVDLEARYGLIMIHCNDAQRVQAATTLSAQVGAENGDTLGPLYVEDAAASWISGTLPTSGAFQFILPAAAGARRLRLILSNAASGGSVVFEVYGLDKLP